VGKVLKLYGADSIPTILWPFLIGLLAGTTMVAFAYIAGWHLLK
jgi:hypothetical protein